MKIIRNGQEFELTSAEMRQAYYEMKEEYTIEDIRSQYNMPDDKITEALMLFEGFIDDDDDFWDSYWSMIKLVANVMGLEEREGLLIMLQAIETKFGTIYIEGLNSKREEEDRIKVFDSEKKYIEYFSIEFLEDYCRVENHALEEEYQLRIKNLKECDTIESLVGSILLDWDLITVNWFEAADRLGIDYPIKQMVLDELKGNEYVNKIGEYYIVLAEC